jgi:hypothetical protein
MARTIPKPRRRRWLLPVLCLLVVSIGLLVAAVVLAYERIGRTPGELMDYAERRLQGHNRLETVALPLIGGLRNALNEPSAAVRARRPFVVPAPPTLPLAPSSSMGDTSGPAVQRIVRVGPLEALRTVAEAARAARDGDIVEIQAGTYRGDVAVWSQKKLTIRGVGGRVRLMADGRSAEGKAIWVLRNGEFDISNIDFIGARVADKNGAGIRFESGRLRVSNCLFWASENGILTTGSPLELDIRNSEFGYNGAGDGLSHHLYAGHIRALKVTGSYFHHAHAGHLLKSRAMVSTIAYNRFSDEAGGRASYELDFPNGGVVHVLGNIVQQNRETENSVIVTYGEEGLLHDHNRLLISSNTLVNDHPYGGTFVRVASGTDKVVLANNLLVGRGGIQIPFEYVKTNNPRVDWTSFALAARQDFRLNAAGREHRYEAEPALADAGAVTTPEREYLHPLEVRTLTKVPEFAGALQSSD